MQKQLQEAIQKGTKLKKVLKKDIHDASAPIIGSGASSTTKSTTSNGSTSSSTADIKSKLNSILGGGSPVKQQHQYTVNKLLVPSQKVTLTPAALLVPPKPSRRPPSVPSAPVTQSVFHHAYLGFMGCDLPDDVPSTTTKGSPVSSPNATAASTAKTNAVPVKRKDNGANGNNNSLIEQLQQTLNKRQQQPSFSNHS